ncbi:MAG: tRNA (guanosine(46)-N7)-methyltransferase TrmB [Bacteroidales bacterium]|nr:tRNA (guanosine(46)-N7)-methyltransferase TrmB [Bacteroidales bacterium]
MGKQKLIRFAENATFDNLFQPSYAEVITGFRLKGLWGKEYFSNAAEIIIELGCGQGEYTVGLAERYPDQNFIGIDIKGARLWHGCKASVEKGLKNVAFIRTRIEMIDHFFSPGEVGQIWITFPDPKIKNHQALKRLTSPIFLNKYKNFLKNDHIIHLKSDDPGFFDYTMKVIKQNHHKLLFETKDLYNAGIDEDAVNILTFYEKMWLEVKKRIFYLKFRLQ